MLWDGRYVEKVLCDWWCIERGCCVMEGLWKELCDWRYVESCVMVGVHREYCVMGGIW